jgi:hypothetical protein
VAYTVQIQADMLACVDKFSTIKAAFGSSLYGHPCTQWNLLSHTTADMYAACACNHASKLPVTHALVRYNRAGGFHWCKLPNIQYIAQLVQISILRLILNVFLTFFGGSWKYMEIHENLHQFSLVLDFITEMQDDIKDIIYDDT